MPFYFEGLLQFIEILQFLEATDQRFKTGCRSAEATHVLPKGSSSLMWIRILPNSIDLGCELRTFSLLGFIWGYGEFCYQARHFASNTSMCLLYLVSRSWGLLLLEREFEFLPVAVIGVCVEFTVMRASFPFFWNPVMIDCCHPHPARPTFPTLFIGAQKLKSLMFVLIEEFGASLMNIDEAIQFDTIRHVNSQISIHEFWSLLKGLEE